MTKNRKELTLRKEDLHTYELRTYENESLIRFSMMVRSGIIYVCDLTIMVQDKLILPHCLCDCNEKNLDIILSEWLKMIALEMCPYKSGPDLDKWISDRLSFSKEIGTIGRLDRFVASVGLLNHFKTDQFYVSTLEPYFWGELSYPGWTTLFIDKPIEWEELECI